ncbi:MAG: calcium/sodium antiporter [Maritimibacter sp.]|nr:calcium/sodium antiporter [Maritimibacter sp.]
MIWLELFGGLVLLLVGGEALVRGSVAAATRLGVSQFLIGLTLVGFGTSMPELVASLQAAMIGAPGIAIGNIVGSNIANILLILGVSAVIFPIATQPRAFARDGAVLIGASLLFAGLTLFGHIGRGTGIALVLLLLAYTLFTYFADKNDGAQAEMHSHEAAELAQTPMALWAALALALAGIVGVVWGADLLVGASVEIARAAGLSEAVIGLTLVAVGTSLPELVTSVMAAIRRHGDVAIGNVIGSNIFNVLGIGGVTAAVSPIAVPAQIVELDVWVMLGAALLAVVFATTGRVVSRREGGVFIALYLGYLAVQLNPALRETLGLS